MSSSPFPLVCNAHVVVRSVSGAIILGDAYYYAQQSVHMVSISLDVSDPYFMRQATKVIPGRVLTVAGALTNVSTSSLAIKVTHMTYFDSPPVNATARTPSPTSSKATVASSSNPYANMKK